MKRPTIREALFDAGMDIGINTRTLRSIYAILGLEYYAEEDAFTCRGNSELFPEDCPAEKFGWGILIEDSHDIEATPHYILKVGEGDFEKMHHKVFSVRYCDYHSLVDDDGTTVIKEAPGAWKITIWGEPSFIDGGPASMVVKKISKAYAEAMEIELPDYEIVYSKQPQLVDN